MNNFTTDIAAKAENLNLISILRMFEKIMLLKFVEIKFIEPKLTQNQQLNNWVTHIVLIIDKDTIFKWIVLSKKNRHRKKNNQSNPSETQIQTTKDK